ncbi:MAG: T9SS type A sorting domain-containing protein [bacterium]
MTLQVYDLAGREVITLLKSANKPAGKHSLIFDAARSNSGIYFYELRAGANIARKKMLLAR